MPTSSYDIEKIFEDIEEELIASMMRNFKRHQVAEVTEGKQWNQWQAEMLQGLEEYKKRNYSKFSKSRKRIDKMLDKALREAGKKGANDEQRKALEALRKGVPIKGSNDGINASFFGVNDQKMNALINATTNDLTTARASALRLAEDEYRQTMFKAQTYAASGAGTYEKAVDMATKDFLSKGINSIIYANGARHTISDYAKMAIRTANKRAYLMGAGAKRAEWGVHTVIVNMRNRESACPKCAQFIGKVLVDDVYSGGTAEEAEMLGYGLVSEAMEQGLFHPNCKDSLSTYYPELYEDGELPEPADNGLTEEEQLALEQNEAIEQKIGNAERIADKYARLEEYALDNDDKEYYEDKKISFKEKLNSIKTTFTNLKNTHEPMTLGEYDNKDAKNVLNIINNGTGIFAEKTRQLLDKIVFVNEKYQGRMHISTKGISVNWGYDAINERGAYQATFHEIGHWIDKLTRRQSNKGELYFSLKRDFDDIVYKYMGLYNVDIDTCYKRIGDMIVGTRFHSISDLFGGLSDNKCVGSYFHPEKNTGKKYWTEERAEREAFAHFYEANMTGDEQKLDLLKMAFPRGYAEFERIFSTL